MRNSAIRGDWASLEGRLVLGFVLIVVAGARFTRRLAGFSVAHRVVRMVGRRVVLAGLVVGPGPIVSLAVVELVAARFAVGRIRGIRGACRMQGDARSHRRDQGDSEDGHQGVRHFGSSCANDRRRKDNPSYTVVEVITTRGLGRELYPAATSGSTAIVRGNPAGVRTARTRSDPTMGPGESAKALGCREREERIGPAERSGTPVDLQTQSLQGVEPEKGAVPASTEHDPRRAQQPLALEDDLSDGSGDL